MNGFHGAPRFLARPKPMGKLAVGENVVIACQIAGDPTQTVSWKKDGRWVKSDEHFEEVFEDDLYGLGISGLRSSDSGEYVCCAKNAVGEAYMGVVLNVEESHFSSYFAATEKPRFISEPVSQHVQAGKDVVFSCEVAKGQPPKLWWENNGQVLRGATMDDRYSMDFVDNQATLSISAVCPEDAGTYVCNAKNDIGEASAAASLSVENLPNHKTICQSNLIGHWESPTDSLQKGHSNHKYYTDVTACRRDCAMQTFQRPFDDLHHGNDLGGYKSSLSERRLQVKNCSIVEGRHAKFSCCVTGKPKPSVIWQKDGRLITEDHRHHIYEAPKDIRVLKVLFCRPRDIGLYTCSASSSLGQTFSAVRLDVKEPDSRFPEKLRDAEARERGKATLMCQIPFGALGRGWYRDGELLQPGSRFLMEELGTLRRLIIRDVQPDDDGIYVYELDDGSRTVSELSVKGKIAKRLPRKLKATEGDQAVFQTQMTSSQLQSHWLWKGEKVLHHPRAVIQEDGLFRFLILHDLRPEDSGEVSFVVDGSRTTSQLCVKGAAHKIDISPPEQPMLQKSSETSAMLSWLPPNPSVGVHGYKVEYSKLGSNKWFCCHQAEYLQETNTTAVVPEDGEYIFRVFAVYTNGQNICKDIPGSIHLLSQAKFTRGLEDILLPEGEEATFSVELMNPMKGHWLLNGQKEIASEGRFKIKQDGGTHYLSISKVEREDDQMKVKFVCRTEESAADLHVQAVPQTLQLLEDHKSELTVTAGEPVILICQTSTRNCFAKWLRDGQDLIIRRKMDEDLIEFVDNKKTTPQDDISSGEIPDRKTRTDGIAEKREDDENLEQMDHGNNIDDKVPGKTEMLRSKCIPENEKEENWNEPRTNEIVEEEVETDVTGMDIPKRNNTVEGIQKGEKEVTMGEDEFLMEAQDCIRRLIIQKSRLEHSGIYQCSTRDDVITFKLVVEAPPDKFMYEGDADIQRDLHLIAGEHLELTCQVCRPGVPVKWFHGGEELLPGDRVQQEADGTWRRLLINRVDLEDSGSYSCLTNDDQLDFCVTVSAPPEKFTRTGGAIVQGDLNLIVGERLELSCQVCRPEVPVKWFHGGKELLPGDRVQQEEDGKWRRLVINSADIEDSGSYGCLTKDDQLDFCVTVSAPPDKFTSEGDADAQQDLQLIAGEHMELTCQVCRPDVPVKWFHGGKELLPRDRVQQEADGNWRRLVINSADIEDSGSYSCLTNDDQLDFCVTVSAPPEKFVHEVDAQQDIISVLTGEHLELSCQVCRPEIPVKWFHAGKQLLPGEQVEQQADDNWRRLIITDVKCGDAGSYCCLTQHDQFDFSVTVSEPPQVEFLIPLHDITVQEGEQVTLSCTLSQLDANVCWLYAGNPINCDSRVDIACSGPQHMLTIHETTVNDTGEITVMCDGVDSHAYLHIEEAAVTFERRLEPIAAKEGDTVHLRVQLSRPGNHVIWTRNGSPVLPKEHLSMEIDGREVCLNIRQLTFEDRGIYACETNHDHTRARLSVEPLLIRLVKPLAPVEICEHGTACFHLKLSHADVAGHWLKNGRLLEPSNTCLIAMSETTHSLALSDIRQSDSGSIMFTTEMLQTSAYLTVLEPPVHILRPLQNLEVPEKSRVLLECEVSKELVDVEWFKGDEKLHHGEKFRLLIQGQRHCVLLPRCEYTDAGTYKCRVGEFETSAQLIVRARDVSIVRGLEPVDIAEGESVTFSCEISDDDVKVTWFQNDKRVKTREGVRIRHQGTLHTLTFYSVTAEDAGEITFVAENATFSTWLTVREPPAHFTKQLRDKMALEGRRAVFECRVSRANAAVQWFCDETEIHTGDRFEVRSIDVIHTLVIHPVTIEDEGSYTCETDGDCTEARLLVEPAD
uniref:obscurin-like protein 1 n=1 Tax=Myxine glutinosa TaxID=7769 RepID=UPI0035901E98